jgi:hypothetical protein
MIIKYSEGKVRLWKAEKPSLFIGIKFKKDGKAEIDQIYQAIQCLLTLRYGAPTK